MAGSPYRLRHEAARVVGARRRLDAWKLARLLAHVHLAQADAFIASFDNKYFDRFWRPVTAIRLGNLDPATPGDPAWNVLGSTVPAIGATPPVPEYASAHAAAGGSSGEAIMANVPGRVAFSMTSGTSQTGQPRSWGSVDEAIRENCDSRVWLGFHFRQSTVMGEAQGRAIGGRCRGRSQSTATVPLHVDNQDLVSCTGQGDRHVQHEARMGCGGVDAAGADCLRRASGIRAHGVG